MDQPVTADPRLIQNASGLPDVASNDDSQLRGRLDRVGMGGIEVPIRLKQPDGALAMVPASADAYVNLEDPDAKGIHMSRLFLALQETIGENELSPALVDSCLTRFIDSHEGLSSQSEITLRYEHMLLRAALKSDNRAWRSYPVTIKALKTKEQTIFHISLRVTYSSTCPCSAALARQLIQESFRRDFGDQNLISSEDVEQWLGTEEAICATPHSQRSYADIDLIFDACSDFGIESLVDGAEGVLKTAVQAAVKREDEQEFARLNGQNLMFCEDAARRMKHWLDQHAAIDYRVKVSHVESLHPHDAVSIAVKGVAGGLKAE